MSLSLVRISARPRASVTRMLQDIYARRHIKNIDYVVFVCVCVRVCVRACVLILIRITALLSPQSPLLPKHKTKAKDQVKIQDEAEAGKRKNGKKKKPSPT